MSIWADAHRKNIGLETRLEDKNSIKNNVPAELYDIEPGQIVVFVPDNGIDFKTAQKVNDLFSFLNCCYIDNTKVRIVETYNEDYLIGNLACRSKEETTAPYKVAVGSWDTLVGLVAEYTGQEVDEILDKVSKANLSINIPLSKDRPTIISINPKKNPTTQSGSIIDEVSDDYVTELLVAPPAKGSKKEKNFIKAQEDKIIKVLRDCSLFDITLDLAGLNKRFKESLKSKIDHKIILDIETVKEGSLSFCTTCDIYVGEGEDYLIPLTAVEKATYLTFLLYENGIRILDTSDKFRRITQKIYNQLPDEDKCEKTAGGILDKGDVIPEVYEKTLRGYMSTIAGKINAIIANPKTAQKFAIEGYKDKEFGVEMGTSEIRAQIKKAFNL